MQRLTHIAVFIGFIISLSATAPVWGQFRQDFEKLAPSWQRSETDCVLPHGKWKSRRVNEQSRNNRYEKIQFTTGQGTHIFVTHDVSPALVIPELTASVKIRSAHRGAKILVRVVLPDTPSPDGSGPLTTLISGQSYRSNGKWQEISVGRSSGRDLGALLKEKSWLLNREYGQEVSTIGAYVDKVVLNLYSGPGDTTIDIDDLEVNGIVATQPVAVVENDSVVRDEKVQPAAGSQNVPDNKKSLVVRDGTVLLVKKQPFFARIVQHRGEPFDYLKALGFNTIELTATATYQQLEQASKLDIWLICPPPSNVGLERIPFHFDRVMAWKLGDHLTGRQLPVIQQRIQEIHESDQRTGRPVVAHADSDWTKLAEMTDIMVAGFKPLGTSFIASQYGQWVKTRSEAIGDGKPIWVDIQTELSPALIQQVKTITPNLPPTPIEPEQIKFLAYQAISGGARGLRFTSHNRLDAVDPVTRLRARTLEWLNAHLGQLEPWIAGGALMGRLPIDNPQVEVTAINTNRSRLLLIQRPTHHEQYLAGDQMLTTVTFQDVESAFSNNAHLIGWSGLATLPNTRTIGGSEIKIDNCPGTAAVVLTQDPRVINWLSSSYQRFSQQSILQMQLELTRQWLAIEQLIDEQIQRIGRQTPALVSELSAASVGLENATRMINQGNHQSAEQFLRQSRFHLAQARREIVNEPLGSFQSKTSAALTSHCSLVPFHWTLAQTLADRQWNPNGLAGGDFENLQHMLSTGWQNRRANSHIVVTKVALTEDAAVDGRLGLKLSVSPIQQSLRATKLIESSPLIIQTPEVRVKVGQLVRIHGWVNVPSPLLGSHDGLRITDNLAGPDMAERIAITDGWQEFTLYRGVKNAGQVSVQFEMTGAGVAMVDEVTIRTVDLPANGIREAKRQESAN